MGLDATWVGRTWPDFNRVLPFQHCRVLLVTLKTRHSKGLRPFFWDFNQISLTLQPLIFWKKARETPKKARVLLFAEPLKSLETKGKRPKKARKIGKRKKQGNRKKQGLEGQGSGWLRNRTGTGNRNRRNRFSRNRNRNRNRRNRFPGTETGTGTVLSCETVLKHRQTFFADEPPEPKTGTARTVPSPNRNRTEPNRRLPEILTRL